jgi:hypothetical protein
MAELLLDQEYTQDGKAGSRKGAEVAEKKGDK